MIRRWAMAGAALALAVTSCELSPRLYLSVRSEAGSPVRSVRVRVYSPPGASAPLPDGTLQRALAPGMKVDLRVLAQVGGERIRVLVDGFVEGSDEVRVRQDWITSLPAEGGGYIQVVLWNTCLGNPCTPGATCASDGFCVPNEVGPAPISHIDGGALGACAAGDGGGCSARMDGGTGIDVPRTDAAMTDAVTLDAGTPTDVVERDMGTPIDRPDATADATVDAGTPIDRPDATADVPPDGGRCPGPSTTARPGWTHCGSVWCPTACGDPSGCSHVQSLRLGRDHACALRADRRVVCWGTNGFGALGNNLMDGVTHPEPVEVIREATGAPLFGMQSVFSGFDGNCGVDDIGDLVCWGAAGGDPFGLEFNPAYAARPATRLRRADAGVEDNTYTLAALAPDETCAVTRRGGVRCRSRRFFHPDGTGEYYPSPSLYPVTDILREDGGALNDVTDLGMGIAHACATRRDGSLWCWGTNRAGQLARPLVGTTGGLAYSDVARRVTALGAVTSLAVGDFFTCALVGADIRCWGLAAYSRLGTYEGLVPCADSNDCAITPLSVNGLADIVRFQASAPVQVSAAAEHACARLANGSVWCWGYNIVGELGLPNTGTGAVGERLGVSGPPVFTGADEVITGGSGGGEDRSWTCAHRADDCTWWCWGRIPGEAPPAAEPWRPRAVRWAP